MTLSIFLILAVCEMRIMRIICDSTRNRIPCIASTIISHRINMWSAWRIPTSFALVHNGWPGPKRLFLSLIQPRLRGWVTFTICKQATALEGEGHFLPFKKNFFFLRPCSIFFLSWFSYYFSSKFSYVTQLNRFRFKGRHLGARHSWKNEWLSLN